LPTPLLQHPLVAGSIILIAAAATQVAVWLVSARPQPMQASTPPSVVVYDLLYDLARSEMAAQGLEAGRANSILVIANLLMALLSGVAWFGVARLGLGPKWGLWTGLFWVIHPSFAFLANQAEGVNLLIVIVPASWCALLAWRRSRRPRTALLFGVVSAIACFVGFQGLLMAAIAVPAMLLSTRKHGGRLGGAAATLVGLTAGGVVLAAVVLAPQVLRIAPAGPEAVTASEDPAKADRAWTLPSDRLAATRLSRGDALSIRAALRLWLLRAQLVQDVEQASDRVNTDLWNALDDGTGSPMAIAARNRSAQTSPADRPSAVAFLIGQCRTAPRQCVFWFAGRFWRSIYATVDGLTHYPLVVLQFTWLAPALWGFWIALRYRPWRWLAVTAGLFVLSHWSMVALAEPLSRNLTPVGGFAVLFALVGVVDVYERLFGRRLTAPAPASQPARLRRMQRNLKDEAGL